MKLGIFFLLIINTVFGQVVGPEKKPGLSVELSANASRVRMSDQVVLTVYFRSPSRRTTMWNALSWGAPAGLYLQVLDSSGREVRNDFSPFYHPVPPDLTGKEALISIGGKSFAGFDSQVPANLLFPSPGKYILKCRYHPPLPRAYFKGQRIWGKEDGPIESPGVPISVDE